MSPSSMSPSDNDGRTRGGRRTSGTRERRRDYLPTLSPLAEKLNAKRLASVTLGESCRQCVVHHFDLSQRKF